jgi:cytosine/adenosine deaminase-related metal-dependent hydrolase
MMPIDVLRFHTIGTAEVFGVGDKVGTLTVGKFADFLVVDPAEPDTGPVYDVYATLVFACSVANVERIYVGGNLAVEHSKILVRDFPALTKEVRARVKTVSGRLQESKTAAN